MTTATKHPFLSGHCNPANPQRIHDQCAGVYQGLTCTCAHHQPPAGVTEAPSPPLTSSAPDEVAVPPAVRPPGLRVLPDLEQGSPEWHDQRRGMVTASVVGQLITSSTLKPASNDTARSLTALLVAERITGYTEPTWISDDMQRGIEDEPRALTKYSAHYAPIDVVGFMVHDSFGFDIGYSPDALVGDDGLVEVKSRRQKKQLQTILADQVPPENMAQLQCGLLVSGREWIDYVSWCGGMPMYVKRVLPDPRWFVAIVAAVEQFEKTAAEMVATYRTSTEGLVPTERPVLDLEIVI